MAKRPPINVQAIREEMGLSKEEFAKRSPFSRRTIYRWEHGEFEPSPMAVSHLEQMLSQHRATQKSLLPSATSAENGGEHGPRQGGPQRKTLAPAKSSDPPTRVRPFGAA